MRTKGNNNVACVCSIFNFKFLLDGSQESGRVGGLVLPGSRQTANTTVVARQTVDTGLHQNKTILLVIVLGVLFQVLAHSHSLLDQKVQILRESRSQTLGLRRGCDECCACVCGEQGEERKE